MMMKISRTLLIKINEWKAKNSRLPLIVRGVRQVGKTSLIEHFGKSSYPNFVKVDLEKEEDIRKVFQAHKDPKKIVEEISVLRKQPIPVDDTLLFIDEIQACPAALTSLKYFAEDMPQMHVISAGSQLGILLSGLSGETFSFPVGKVEYLDLYPLTFFEFIDYVDSPDLRKLLLKQLVEQKISEAIHDHLWELWKLYIAVGGMPGVVLELKNEIDRDLVTALTIARTTQNNLITAYEADIAKHCGKVNAQHIVRVLKAIPSRLGMPNNETTKRFTFKDVVPGIRGYERLSSAIDWITSAGLAYRLPMVKTPRSPLKGFEDETLFKFFFFDVGLFGALSGLPITSLRQFEFGMYKGFLAETFVLQELKANLENAAIACYHTPSAEIEFLIENDKGIIPIEVKSSTKFTKKSLANYEKKYDPKRSYLLSARADLKSPHLIRKLLPLYASSLVETEK
jgi:uncharacterized protein